MFTPKTAAYTMIVSFCLAVAACQPHEGPAERAGKSIDNAADKAGDKIESAGDKIKDSVNDAKK
jgi:hypothetical protein